MRTLQIFRCPIMVGLVPEGSHCDSRHYDAKMTELLGNEQEFFTVYDEVYDSFDAMGLQENLLRGIYAYGFEKPYAIQQRGIVPFCKGLDVILQAQSRTGRMATFCSGILQRLDYSLVECQALVLAPSRERVQQIAKVVRALGHFLGVKAHASDWATNLREEQHILQSGVHAVVGTPSCVFDMLLRRTLRTDHIKMFVLDDADELLARVFKDRIYDIFQRFPQQIQVGVFSATMPAEVLEITRKFMSKPVRIFVQCDELTLEEGYPVQVPQTKPRVKEGYGSQPTKKVIQVLQGIMPIQTSINPSQPAAKHAKSSVLQKNSSKTLISPHNTHSKPPVRLSKCQNSPTTQFSWQRTCNQNSVSQAESSEQVVGRSGTQETPVSPHDSARRTRNLTFVSESSTKDPSRHEEPINQIMSEAGSDRPGNIILVVFQTPRLKKSQRKVSRMNPLLRMRELDISIFDCYGWLETELIQWSGGIYLRRADGTMYLPDIFYYHFGEELTHGRDLRRRLYSECWTDFKKYASNIFVLRPRPRGRACGLRRGVRVRGLRH